MRANPTVIGIFVVGAVILGVGGVLLFGSGDYFAEMEYYILFFEDDVDGLRVGSPVKLEGVRVGKVSDVHLEWNLETGETRIPVTIETPAVVGTAFGGRELVLAGTFEERTQKLIDAGLRASLATESFITGQLAVNLEFMSDAPVRLIGGDLPHAELPTVRSKLKETLAKLAEIPFNEIALDIQKLVRNVDARVGSDDVTRLLQSIPETLEPYREFGEKLDARIDPLVDNIEGTSTEARLTLEKAGKAVETVESDLHDLKANLDKALNSIRKLADDVDAKVQPTAEDLRKTMETLRQTLESIDGAAKSLDLLLRDDSPTVSEIKKALAAIADGARAIKALAQTLERQPESLFRGKRGG